MRSLQPAAQRSAAPRATQPLRVERAGRDVRRVVEIGALVERADRRRRARAARMADAMHRRRAGHVAHVVARARAAAGTGRRPPSRGSSARRIRRPRRAPRGARACTRPTASRPRRWLAARDRRVGDDVAPRHRQPRQQPAQQRGAAEQPGQHVRVAARASLHRSVRVRGCAGRRSRTPACASSSRSSARKRARHEPAVGVHDQHERRASSRPAPGSRRGRSRRSRRCGAARACGANSRDDRRRCRRSRRCRRRRLPTARPASSSAIDCSAARSSSPAL